MGRNDIPLRTLTVLRHAKSSWKHASLDDIDRPLSKRGRREADVMGARIIRQGGSLDVIFASPARRSQETIFRILSGLPVQETRLIFDKALYTFDSSTLIEALKTLDDSLLQVTIVGHNPALEDAIDWLAGATVGAFPTAACAQLRLPIAHWSGLKKGCATIGWCLVPEKRL